MSRLILNKSALSREQRRLSAFSQFLPSLDLKRRQIMAAKKDQKTALAELRDTLRTYREEVGRDLPMLGTGRIDCNGLVWVTQVDLRWENLVGIRLPVMGEVRFGYKEYGYLGMPHWVDRLVILMREVLELRVKEQIFERRLRLLEEAQRKTTQRLNLLDKVLIPQARANIKKINLFLADQERAEVVRAKIAKAKREGA
ncbi:V-type ATP synthase subunit D [Sulfidibacter corallicola]|uniref:V-type ATP synthase subunit D n=1 Tax=Sulfidibacter corallicola TaxID=2818388 RepID=A0A8A4TIS0_SULCO|nr:V-type ATP synthase subunit D [Sulfidibacter corallicola]QTD49387.1 V-type ATP synthase subunit D [Sulfidibacter corallicola]